MWASASLLRTGSERRPYRQIVHLMWEEGKGVESLCRGPGHVPVTPPLPLGRVDAARRPFGPCAHSRNLKVRKWGRGALRLPNIL